MITIDYSRYMGLPYTSYNCWELCCLFLQNEMGINTKRMVTIYDGCFNINHVTQVADKEKKRWQKVIESQKGDIVELHISKQDFHVGIIPYHGHVLHVEKGGVSLILPLIDKRIKSRVRSFWRYRKNGC